MNLKVTAALAATVAFGAIVGLAGNAIAEKRDRDELLSTNASGVLRTISTAGSAADTSSPFFQDLGTNGRTCVSCHRPAQAWSVTPEEFRDGLWLAAASTRSLGTTTDPIAKAPTSRRWPPGGKPSAADHKG